MSLQLPMGAPFLAYELNHMSGRQLMTASAAASRTGGNVKILVVYYSVFGHVLKLAHAVVEGIQEVDDAEAVLRRAAPFPGVEEQLRKNEQAWQVWQDQKSISECTLDDLRQAAGILFGSPTRYGNMIAEMKRLIDSTAQLWLSGELEGKPAGVFTSTASTHGGQETTSLTMTVPLFHLGMIIVGVPYSTPGMVHTEARGGAPYGASTIAGPHGELTPTEEDLTIARWQGKRVAEIARKLSAS
jgi:NAD(P)H dehydrogenase (quinone)